MYANDSIELLQKSGIDFRRHEENGIDIATFGEILITSGFVLFDEVHWISFHRYFLLIQMESTRRVTERGMLLIACMISGTY